MPTFVKEPLICKIRDKVRPHCKDPRVTSFWNRTISSAFTACTNTPKGLPKGLPKGFTKGNFSTIILQHNFCELTYQSANLSCPSQWQLSVGSLFVIQSCFICNYMFNHRIIFSNYVIFFPLDSHFHPDAQSSIQRFLLALQCAILILCNRLEPLP